MIIHGGALFSLGGGGSTDLVCCDECGVIAAESVAQTGGWGMWAESSPQRIMLPLPLITTENPEQPATHPRRVTPVRHHHCPAHIREDGSQWYASEWSEWEWAR
jgi:hypothetical protein